MTQDGRCQFTPDSFDGPIELQSGRRSGAAEGRTDLDLRIPPHTDLCNSDQVSPDPDLGAACQCRACRSLVGFGRNLLDSTQVDVGEPELEVPPALVALPRVV